jgi:2-dehydropantoate 2-reductase
MKVVIVGPGALGCLLAAHLGRFNPVQFFDHDPARAASLEGQGVVLENDDGISSIPVRATAEPGAVVNAELVLLCVKSPKVSESICRGRPFLARAGLILALQNGISHLESLPNLLAESCWGLGVTAQGATLVGPGRVRHRGRGVTMIGWPPAGIASELESDKSCRPGLEEVARTMTDAGIETVVADDILPHLWAKLLVNVGINALTAIHDCPNGALLESKAVLARLTAAVREGAAVAEKKGIRLERDPVSMTIEVCRATGANLSSMLQDVRAQRLTEIDAINGALIRQARPLGLPVEVNEELVRQVRALERNYHDFS